MAMSETQKRARDRWDKKNMTVVGCKVTKSKAQAFREACAAAGTNPNTVFSKVIDKWIGKEGRE